MKVSKEWDCGKIWRAMNHFFIFQISVSYQLTMHECRTLATCSTVTMLFSLPIAIVTSICSLSILCSKDWRDQTLFTILTSKCWIRIYCLRAIGLKRCWSVPTFSSLNLSWKTQRKKLKRAGKSLKAFLASIQTTLLRKRSPKISSCGSQPLCILGVSAGGFHLQWFCR